MEVNVSLCRRKGGARPAQAHAWPVSRCGRAVATRERASWALGAHAQGLKKGGGELLEVLPQKTFPMILGRLCDRTLSLVPPPRDRPDGRFSRGLSFRGRRLIQ